MSLWFPDTELPDRFEGALQDAMHGQIRTEWPFDDATIAALQAVAGSPTPENVDAARSAFRDSTA